MKRIESTLLILRDGDKILLAKKKRGFGEGLYNGVGGKLKKGESVLDAMIRETQEEIGVTPTTYEKYGINEFLEFVNDEETNLVFHLFIATEWEGEPTESEEMVPEWFDIDSIPYDKMFKDDRYWLPLVLEGKKVRGKFEFDKEWNSLAREVKVVEGELAISTFHL